MDKMYLSGLRFFGYHGALKEEQVLGQIFIVDLVLHLSLEEAGQNDDLTQSVHYGLVYEEVKKIVEGAPVKLIETVAHNVSNAVLLKFNHIEALTVKVIKPNPPINGHYDSVAVEITRGRVRD